MALRLDAIERQNAEFAALHKLATALNRLDCVAVVDDDYPRVRHEYEAALKDFLRDCAANRPGDYRINA